jgi:hypothetical protein
MDFKQETKISYSQKYWYESAGKELWTAYKDQNIFIGGQLVGDTYGGHKLEYNPEKATVEAKVVLTPSVTFEGHLIGAAIYGTAGAKTYSSGTGFQVYVGAGFTALIGGCLKFGLGVGTR